MARFLSTANHVVAAAVAGRSHRLKLLPLLSTRGYAGTTSAGTVITSDEKSTAVMMKSSKEVTTETSPWVPDPVTGYYRPVSHADEVDPAELRRILLSRKAEKEELCG